jgi:class 3 adenylate cyclase/tetratricopeptide (TPR) repeat protein
MTSPAPSGAFEPGARQAVPPGSFAEEGRVYGALEGERKRVTVLFADLKGSMQMLADRDPEEARRLLDPVLERMMEAVHRYEGTVNQVLGDGIMALFGAPVAHEEHAARACWAALTMQESIARYGAEIRSRLGIPVQIRVGINSGEVVVRAIGNDLHMDYSAIGETTHLAARVEEMAPPGGIRLTANTLRLAEAFVHVRPVGPVQIKGLREPVEVFDLLGARPVRRFEAALVRGLTRFVGRQTELEALGRALEGVRGGHGGVVAVVGEPGVGKSRLFLELTQSPRLRDWFLLEGGTVSYGREAGYLPLLDLLRRYFKIQDGDSAQTVREKVTGGLLALDSSLGEASPPLLAVLGAAPDDSPFLTYDPPRRRELTQEALKRFLFALTRIQPVLLIMEDLQWIDFETQAFLDHLVDSLPSVRLLLLVNYRPEYRHGWGGKTYYTQIRLDPLSPESADAFLEALLGDDDGLRQLKGLMIDRTEGNPFFLEEIARALADSGALVGERGAYRLATTVRSIEVPPTVQAVLAARIDRLPPDEKALLQCASVIGKDVPLVLLQAIAEQEALRRALRHLQAVELLYERSLFDDVVYTFKHTLTHEVAYQSLLHERAKRLHAGVVDAIERLYGDRLAEQAEVLAHHAVRGEVWDKAVDYLRAAGGRAFAKGSVDESLLRYEQALSLVARLPRSPENLRRMIDVRLDLHVPLVVLGQIPRLVQLHDESERLARELGDPRRLGRVLYWMAQFSYLFGRYNDGIEFAGQALSLAREVDDPEVRVLATYALGLNHCLLGAYGPAVDFFMRFVEGPDAEWAKRVLAVTAPAYVVGCTWLAFSATRLGRLPVALDYSDRAVRLADTFDHPQAQAIAYTLRAIPLVYRGDLGPALELVDRAVRLCETRTLFVWLPAALCALGWVLASSGRAAEGVPHLQRGTALMETIGVKAHRSLLYGWCADALLLAGSLEDAERVAGHAVELAVAAGERGSEAEARYITAQIVAARASTDLESAAAHYEQVRGQAAKLEMRPLLARCHLSLGQLYQRGGRLAAAREHLNAAVALFREMGMRRWLAEAEVALT